MRPTLLILFAVLAGAVHAQSAPVTLGEANEVLDRVDTAIRKVIGLPPMKAKSARGSRAVKRSEVIDRFNAMFESYRPKFQYTPRPARSEPSVVAKFNTDKVQVETILKLSRFGCLAPVGPLVVGPSEAVSVADFGDAVGFFFSQIASLTYTADPKWTPALMPPDGG